MRDDIKQRSQAMQDMIQASTMDNRSKSMLSNRIASTAESTNGLSEPEKLNAICLNMYQLTEYIAILGMQVSGLPCVDPNQHKSCPSKQTDMPNQKDKTDFIYNVLKDFKWAIVVLISVLIIGIVISPALQDCAKSGVKHVLEQKAK